MTRIGVIGGGPKALAALIELAWAMEHHDPHGVIEIDVFEPHTPGAGAVWSVETPSYLVMNVTADIVNMSSPTFPKTYTEWAEQHDNPRARTIYPPRAIMGEYLKQAFSSGVQKAKNLRVRHVAQAVGRVTQSARGGWSLNTKAGAEYGPYNKLLLATGHFEPFAPQWYKNLESADGVGGAGETVMIKGAALTGIDAVMALTIGRNGTFEMSAEGAQTYVPSGREPTKIELVSRTGVPLAPKPQHVSQHHVESIQQALEPLIALGKHEAALPNTQWWDVLVGAVTSVAPKFGASVSEQSVRNALFTADILAPGETAQTRLKTQLDMNSARKTPDEKWVIGRVWNAGYKSIVESLQRTRRSPKEWATFRDVAAKAERWAFGPPQETVHKLLALTDAGILSWRTQLQRDEPFDVLAITQPPGVKDPANGYVSDALWQQLIEDGHCVVRPLERGVLTSPQGQAVNAQSQLTQGLYVIGRPTEDPVVGHDSLNYRLHADAQRWAAHIVECHQEQR